MALTDSVQGHFSEGSVLWLSYNSNFTLSSSICLAALISIAPEKNLCFLEYDPILKRICCSNFHYQIRYIQYLDQSSSTCQGQEDLYKLVQLTESIQPHYYLLHYCHPDL